MRASRSSSAAPLPAAARTLPGRDDIDDGPVRRRELVDDGLKSVSASTIQAGGDQHGERRCVALQFRRRRGAVIAGKAETERDFERDDESERKEEEASEEPPPHLGTASRKPTPLLVSIHVGLPSFFRREAMWTSTVLEVPYQ